jgi:hypothetical protein
VSERSPTTIRIAAVSKKPNPKPEIAQFDVVYEDGSQLSNRRVPANLFSELDRDARIREFIEKQDQELAERSGRPRGPIKSIVRSR